MNEEVRLWADEEDTGTMKPVVNTSVSHTLDLFPIQVEAVSVGESVMEMMEAAPC